MDEGTLRRVVSEVVRGELHEALKGLREELHGEVNGVRGDVKGLREELRSELRAELRAAEERLAEGGRLQFRQLSELYRGTVEKIESLERHVGERLDATRGAIEALRSSIERQDFRADELGRRITALETRPPV